MNTEKHTVSIIVLVFLALVLGFLAVSGIVGFGEGSLILSVSQFLGEKVDSFIGFFHGESLKLFTLVPASAACVLIAISLMRPHPRLRSILLLSLFLGLYFISAYCQGTSGFGLASVLGSPLDLYAGSFMCVFSALTLILIDIGGKKGGTKDKDSSQTSDDREISSDNCSPQIDVSLPESTYVPAENLDLPDALGTLRVVSLPSFMRFPSEIKDKVLRDDIGDDSSGTEGFYMSVGKERRIKKQNKNNNKSGNADDGNPVEKKNNFDLKNLRTAMEQDRAAVDAFPKAGDFTDVISQMDSAFDPRRRKIADESNGTSHPAKAVKTVRSQSKTPEIKKTEPVVPEYDYSAPMSYSYNGDAGCEPMSFTRGETSIMPSGAKNGEYQEPMRIDEMADFVMPSPVKIFRPSHTVFQDAEKSDSSNRSEVAGLDINASEVPEVSFYEDSQEENLSLDSPEPDDSEIDEATQRYAQIVGKQGDVQDNSGKGIDYVSGVGGLSEKKSYLIDKDKFEYLFPKSSLLKHYETTSRVECAPDDEPDGRVIVDTLSQFRIETRLIGVQHGPTFTLYQLALAKGIRVNSVLNLSDNIAMNLAVDGVRILAPIPGKAAIGIEVPNKKRDTIGFDIMYPALASKNLKIPFVLGKTITGESFVIDLANTPHLLIAGTTGSGKSVCVNSLICSVLFTKKPEEVRMMLVDPKMVELSVYNGIPHLLTPVITAPKRAIKGIAFIITEMERRMVLFQKCGVKKIEDYNKKISDGHLIAQKLPYIMVIIDEFADLMMVVGKELESYIQRITQIARFTGIHLVLATQRPSVDVITGIIKSNIPSRIAFAVSDATNSKIILDTVGAEKLLGRGDMLYLSSTSPNPQRIQGAYIDPEIEQIVSVVKQNGEPDYIDESYFEDDEDSSREQGQSSSDDGGDMFTKAWKLVSEKGEASASYLQRKLGIGYNRAATLIEKLEDAGYIGPARGAKPREILHSYMPQEIN